MHSLVTTQYQGTAVTFRDDGWFNATEVASRYNLNPHEWLRLPATQDYLAALERKYGKIPYFKTKRGTGGGTWLHPKLAVRFAQWLDVDFSVWCDEQIESIMHGNHPHHSRQQLRHQAASSFKVMTTMLQMSRGIDGKTTGKHHYMNEAKLVNWALSGEFKGLDRDGMPGADLDLLCRLEEFNSIHIGRGLPYEQRKAELSKFASEWRQSHAPRLNS